MARRESACGRMIAVRPEQLDVLEHELFEHPGAEAAATAIRIDDEFGLGARHERGRRLIDRDQLTLTQPVVDQRLIREWRSAIRHARSGREGGEPVRNRSG